MAELKELFEFFSSERADVRKMATAGIAQISKDNSDLNTFVCKKENKDLVQKFCDLIDPRLPKDIVQTLADVLLALVNISVDTSCCETFVNHNVPLKLLKVYETLQVKGDEVQNSPVLCELALMALNNLTAVSSAACEQVLELDDEDLAGYHFGRLKTHYDRSPDFFDAPAAEEENKEGENKKQEDEDENTNSKNNNNKNTTSQASQRKWLLQVALNISRTMEGTRIFMEDEEWRPIVPDLISHPVPYIRGLGMQLVRNLANYRDISHQQIVDELKCPAKVLYQITHAEDDVTMLHGWVDVLVSLITSESGMKGMDEINAKRALVPLVAESKKKHQEEATSKRGGKAVVEELNDDGTSKESAAAASPASSTRKTPLPYEVAKRLEEEILPYLDDIQDVWINQEGDE